MSVINVIVIVNQLIGLTRRKEVARMKDKLKRFFLLPPKWLERILSKSARYRTWVICEAFKVLADAMRGGGKDG